MRVKYLGTIMLRGNVNTEKIMFVYTSLKKHEFPNFVNRVLKKVIAIIYSNLTLHKSDGKGVMCESAIVIESSYITVGTRKRRRSRSYEDFSWISNEQEVYEYVGTNQKFRHAISNSLKREDGDLFQNCAENAACILM
jgi:hypothetical protein